MDLIELYPAAVNSKVTVTLGVMNADSTIIEVLDGSVLPDAPNLLVLGTDQTAETVKMTAKDGNTLTVERAVQGTAINWPAGTQVARNFTAKDWNDLIENLREVVSVLEKRNLITYTSLEQIGLTKGEETIESIVNALPNYSRLFIGVASGNNTSIYPSGEGTLEVNKDTINRVTFEFTSGSGGTYATRHWFGSYRSTVATPWSGWIKDYDTNNPTVLADGSVPMSGKLNVKNFGELDAFDTNFTMKSYDPATGNLSFLRLWNHLGKEGLLKVYDSSNNPYTIYGEHNFPAPMPNAGFHNSVYRGKSLGSAVTEAQWAAIKAGTFDDLFIGDYWTIGGVTYRIAAFDYYYKSGDNASLTTHHVTLVPDTNMYTHVMNDTNITDGAYVGSKMYTEGLMQAKTTITNAFGSAHILTHRQYLQNATTNGVATGGAWYDSTVELMTEQNVYGCKIFGNCINGTTFPNNYTVDKSQYPLFAFRPDMISNRQWFWLRDVANASYFANVNGSGTATCSGASSAAGVRPAFSIC